MNKQIIIAFLLTIIAGLSTLLELIVIIFKPKNEKKLICRTLSFAAGVMICVSVTDLIPESIKLLKEILNPFKTILFCFLSIITGILLSYIIEKILPDNNKKTTNNKELYKIGIISMITIIIHNIPEGIITFIGTTSNLKLGINLAIAIALHNIPEGISIGVPIYYSTKNKKLAFIYVLISAFSEPLGGLLAFIFLKNLINNFILGILFGLIAGIMTRISLNELIPKSYKYGNKLLVEIWFMIGVILMLVNIMF